MDFQYFILLLLVTTSSTHCSDESGEESDTEIQEHIIALDNYLSSKMIAQPPNEIEASIPREVPDMSIFGQLYETAGDKIKIAGICTGCKIGIGLLMWKVRDANFSAEDVQRITIFACNLFKIATPDVCPGIIERYGPVFKHLFKELPDLSASAFCGVMMQSYGCTTDAPRFEWTVDIPPKNSSVIAPPPPSLKVKDDLRNRKEDNAGRIKIIQMSDLHIDPLYEAGASAECDNKILCCQGSQGRPLDKTLQAGEFGDHRKCDVPYSTLELTLKHISEQHADAKFFYMTGDIVPHNIWSTTEADNSKIIKNVAILIDKYFPTTTVIPVLGNHETHPVNFYSPHGVPPELSTTWIYNVSYAAYQQWIPQNQTDLYLTYGFYALEISDKFKIVVLNTNFCYGFNVWQMYEPGDTGGQLKWLIDHLTEAEVKGQTVHIVGHVPPGHDECFRVFSRNFYQIILRYNHTITGQFYGHTHYGEVKVVYDLSNEPINNLWISPSLTPYETNNVAYRVFFADPLTYQIMDHETWIFDLRSANQNSSNLKWFNLYSGSEAYGIPDVTPKSMGNFVDKMATDAKAFQKYYQHFYKQMDKDEPVTCNIHCRKRILCSIVRSYSGEEANCNRIQKQIDGIVLPISLLLQT